MPTRSRTFPDPVSLVPFQNRDAEILRNFAEPIWRESYRGMISSAQIRYMLDKGYAPKIIRSEIKDRGIDYRWIETADGERSGYLACESARDSASAFLHKFYLIPSLHGAGLAPIAMNGLKTLLLETGIRQISLRVNRTNQRAIRFYRKNGFEVTGEDCLPIGEGFVMDDYLMSCFLH